MRCHRLAWNHWASRRAWVRVRQDGDNRFVIEMAPDTAKPPDPRTHRGLMFYKFDSQEELDKLARFSRVLRMIRTVKKYVAFAINDKGELCQS